MQEQFWTNGHGLRVHSFEEPTSNFMKDPKSFFIPSHLYTKHVSDMMKEILIEHFFNPIDQVTVGISVGVDKFYARKLFVNF